MTLGAGRPAKSPTIGALRSLSLDEVLNTPRGRKSSVKTFRDSHHRVARLFAMGLRPGEVAAEVGYSIGRISTLYADPAFKELIAKYKEDEDLAFRENRDEYYETVNHNRVVSARLINDKLAECNPEDITFRELVTIHADAADRTGYPKRTMAVNVNIDFAARLDRAIKRTREIQSPSRPPPSQVIGSPTITDRREGGLIKRRA